MSKVKAIVFTILSLFHLVSLSSQTRNSNVNLYQLLLARLMLNLHASLEMTHLFRSSTISP